MDEEEKEKIINIFRNPKTGLKGLKVFADENNLDLDKVKTALEDERAYVFNRPVIRKFQTRKTIVLGPNQQFQSDLMDVSNSSSENDGVKFLLVSIDCFTRKAFVFPLADKKGSTVADALKDLLKETTFKKLQVDMGREFYNKDVENLLKKHDIILFSTKGSNSKASIAERFIKTLRLRLARLADKTGTLRYIDDLKDVVEGYNNTVHSSIGIAPNSFKPSDTGKIFKKLYGEDLNPDGKIEKLEPKFFPGDYVRIAMYKGPFSKEGTSQRWSEEVFKINNVIYSIPITYKIEDLAGEEIQGIFYLQEMQLAKKPEEFLVEKIIGVKGRGKNKRYLVKWVGYPSSFDSWEPEGNLPKELIKEFEKSIK